LADYRGEEEVVENSTRNEGSEYRVGNITAEEAEAASAQWDAIARAM